MDWIPMLHPFMMILTACLFSSSPVIILTPVVIQENVETMTPGSFSGCPARRSILETSASSSLCLEQYFSITPAIPASVTWCWTCSMLSIPILHPTLHSSSSFFVLLSILVPPVIWQKLTIPGQMDICKQYSFKTAAPNSISPYKFKKYFLHRI